MLGGVSEAQNSTVRIGADVKPDRFDTGAFGGRPLRGRGDAAMPARVLNLNPWNDLIDVA